MPPGARARLRALVFPRYAAAATLTVARLTPLDVLLRLTRAGAMPDGEAAGLARFLDWLERVPAWSIDYADADRAAALIAASLVPAGSAVGAGGVALPAP